jgi:hypothetical protein
MTSAHEFAVRLFACCNTTMAESTGFKFGRACEQLLDYSSYTLENEIDIAQKL